MATKTHIAAWKVWGNRKDNRVFTAALPKTAKARPGDQVKLTNSRGIETTGTLVEVHASADGLEYWTFDKVRKSREEYLLDVAAAKAAEAKYLEEHAADIAAKLDAREARKLAQEQVANTPNQNGSPKSTKVTPPTEQGIVVDAFAKQVQTFVAAGLDPAAAVTAATAMGLRPGVTVAQTAEDAALVDQVTTTTTKPRKPRQSRVAKQAAPVADVVSTEAAKQGGCRACGKRTAQLAKHVGAKVDGICPACLLKDAETVRMNVIRRSAANASK